MPSARGKHFATSKPYTERAPFIYLVLRGADFALLPSQFCGHCRAVRTDRRGHAGRRAGLSLDAAMPLVESGLRRAGTTSGARCEEVHGAREDVVRAREAIRIPDRGGIVIRRGL